MIVMHQLPIAIKEAKIIKIKIMT